MGNQVEVVTHQSHALMRDIFEFNKRQSFPIHPMPYRGLFILEALERLSITLKSIKQHRPDVLISFGRQAVWLAACVCRLTKIPFVATGSGSEFLPHTFPSALLTRWAYRLASKVVFISQFTHDLASNFGVHATDSVILPLGADDQAYYPDLPVDDFRATLKLQGKQVILTVGQVSQRKAQDIVIRAMPEILNHVPNAVYLIVGLPTLQQQFSDLAAGLGVAKQVYFAGIAKQEDLPLYYNLADIFVLVSRQSRDDEVEGFGIAVVEAALCGLPAVVSEHTGLVEAILPGETGLVVPQESPLKTAEAILKILSDEPLRKSLGQAARRHALEHSTWRRRISEFNTILEEVLRGC